MRFPCRLCSLSIGFLSGARNGLPPEKLSGYPLFSGGQGPIVRAGIDGFL
jgi:hypothetical protein